MLAFKITFPFGRNVPHDADEEELGQTMERFGQVRYCRLVMNEISATCRGVCGGGGGGTVIM